VRVIRAALSIACLALNACQGLPGSKQRAVAVGAWVEAEGGELRDGVPVVSEIDERERSESDKAEKVELTGLVQSASPDALSILGVSVAVDGETEFESEQREAVARFLPEPGQWVLVKAREKDGTLRARTIRRQSTRARFRIEGELTRLEQDKGIARIGIVPVRLADNARLQTTDQAEEVDPNDPLALFLADEQKGVPFTVRITDDLLLGGELSASGEYDDDLDLRRDRHRDRASLDAEGKLDLLWRFADNGSFVLLEGRYGHEERFRESDADTSDDRENLSRAYAYVRMLDVLRLQVGRQDFDEEREWLYDEILDGVRLGSRFGPVDLEASASMGREFLAEENALEETSMFVGLGRYWLDEEHRLTAYFIQRRDETQVNFEPYLLGLRSYARPPRGLGHWLELAKADGYLGSNRIDGYAIDAGLLYRFEAELRPTIAVGWAFGSGRADGSSRIGFRQTGVQDNNGKFGGVTSFRYYGEVLEPELANLEVLTAGAGIRPTRSSSIDLVGHVYRQDVASTLLADTKLRTAPDGTSRDLGWGLDLIVGLRRANRFTFEVLAGMFDPGNAFDNRDPAFNFAATVRFKF
jgi:alginate production protein